MDLATANEGGTITLLRNRGDGVFEPAAPLDIASNYTPTGVVAGTFNTDAITDVAVAATDSDSLDFTGAALVFHSSAPLQLDPTAVPVGVFPTCVTTGDVTGDGRVDLLLGDSASDGSGHVSVLAQQPDGSFAPGGGISLGTIVPNRLVVADVDHDANHFPDLLVVDTQGNAVWILYGSAAAGFDAPVRLATVAAPVAALVTTLASDTLPGVAIASRLDGQVSVLHQESPRTFLLPTAYTVGLLPADLAAGDVNADGRNDLLCANNGSNNVTLLLGQADGTFVPGETVAVGVAPVALLVADFNGDGKPDFATANQEDDTFGSDVQSVSVVLNAVSPPFTPTPTMPATRTPTSSRTPSSTRTPTGTRTAMLPTSTPTAMVATPRPTGTPAGPGDVNCDGEIDTADLATIIARIFDGTSGCLDGEATAADIPFIIDKLTLPTRDDR